MQQTFLFISQEMLLAGWVIASVLLILGSLWRFGWSADTWYLIGTLLVFGVVGAFLVPRLDIRDAAGHPGVAIRGYGFFVALGVVSGVGLSSWLTRCSGYDAEVIFSAAFVMVICGFLGARFFFVIQNWGEFAGDGPGAFIGRVVRFYEGGLVVYGSLMGAALAFLGFVWWRRLPALRLADLLAPGLMIGLALGRVGCLMNGCCWGGVCTSELALTFPAGSPPYMRHLDEGSLLGLSWETPVDEARVVAVVEPGSRGAETGLRPGDRVARWLVPDADTLRYAVQKAQQAGGDDPQPLVTLLTVDGLEVTWTARQLPVGSLPVHPAQVYSAVNAVLLTLLLTVYFFQPRREGSVFAVMITGYPIARFLLEMIRSDEGGWLGTAWTISQWASVGLLIAAAGLWWVLRRRPVVDPPLAVARSPVK